MTRTSTPRLLAAAGSSLLLAACGTAGVSGAAATAPDARGANDGPFALAKCMRAHGVPNFPDPSAGSGGQVGLAISKSPGSPTLTVNGVTLSGPAFRAASVACRRYMPSGGPGHPVSAAQRLRILRFAACMRAHGVPDFPDPQFPSGGGIIMRAPRGAFPPSSPAFAHAGAVCGGPLKVAVGG